MKNALCLLIFLACNFVIDGQEIFISSSSFRLYKFDLSSCSYEHLSNIRARVTDISFHPNGKLYGINLNGVLYEIDIESGEVNTIHSFSGDNYNSLTISASGVAYATGLFGYLCSYDFSNENEICYGDIGHSATGDLTFYDGDLYAATKNDKIVRIELGAQSIINTSVVVNQDVEGQIFGIVSFAENCSDIATYALTDETSVYEIDFDDQSLNLICIIDLQIFGGASTFEFYASAPLSIQNVEEILPTCNRDDGTIIIEATGGTGVLKYSIDGLNFQTERTFDNLSEGNYSLVVRDENDCSVTYDTELPLNNPFQNIDIQSYKATCGESDGSIVISTNTAANSYQFSLEGSAFQSTLSFDGLSDGTYELSVLTEDGCEFDSTVLISQAHCPIYIPNAFSPNQDDNNDLFTIYLHPSFNGEIKSLSIYNRWGALVYHENNFSPDASGWDGTFRGRKLDTGVYIYQIELIHGDRTPELLKGSVTLMK